MNTPDISKGQERQTEAMTAAGGVNRLRAWRRWMHAGLPVTSPAYAQAYVINVYAQLGVLSLGLFGALHLSVEHNVRLGWFEVADAGVIALTLLFLRFTANVRVARLGFLLALFAALLVMIITGGTAGTGDFWLFLFPVAAFFLGGQKQGILWMAALIAGLFVLFLLSQWGIVGIAYSPVVVRQLAISLVVVTAGIAVYQRSREMLQTQTNTSQNALQAEKIQAETVLANIDEGVMATDPEGRIVLMNQAAERMFGWTFAEAKGRLFTEVAPVIDDAGQVVAADDRPIQQVLKHSKVINPTLTYQRKDGSTFPAVMTGRAITVDGHVRGAIGTIRDISSQIRVDRAKSEFVTLASHQLRTPLSAISWVAEMLLSGDAGPLSEEQRNYIDQLYSSNQRSAEMVDAMLLVSSLELGPVAIQPETMNLPDAMHILIELQQRRLPGGKKLQVEETYDSAVPELQLDPHLTRTIMNNLLSNAFKYTASGGTVQVSVEKSAEKLQPDSDGSVVITVHDTGYGIPLAEQDKLFAKLFRASNIKKKDTDGTGLGLFIVKKILEQVGGQIRFQSAENQGSTFSVVLPLEGMRQHV